MAIGVVAALDALKGVHGRGYTFLRGDSRDELFMSFDQLRLEAAQRGEHLRRAGLKKGDRVALVIPEGEQFIPTFYGALWAGLVPVPLYPPLALGKLDAFMQALTAILNVAEPRLLVTTARIRQLLWSILGNVKSLESLLPVERLAVPVTGPLSAPEEIGPSDLALLQFTSGSTAMPKGVQVTHGNLAASVKAIDHDGVLLDPERDHAVSWLPLYHDMGLIGMVLVSASAGVSATFIPPLSFVKNATLWLETIHRRRGTVTFAPNFAYALVTKRARPEQIRRWDLSCMRVFGCGAEPINPQTLRDFLATFAPTGLPPQAVLPCYGMAEATLAISFVGLQETMRTDRIDARQYHSERRAVPAADGAKAREVVSCGRPFPEHELGIFDESGNRLPDRQVGEIRLRGPTVAAGYFRDPEASRTAGMIEGGWLRTGDLGYLVNGELFVSGRLKDILIIHGRNYYPQEIEWQVEEVAGVRKGGAVVFSRPGAASEELVVVAEARGGNPESLRAAIVARIGEELGLSASDVVVLRPGTVPKTSSGKLQRRKTRELYLSGKLAKRGYRSAGTTATRIIVARHLASSLLGLARHQARGWLKRFLSPTA